MIWLSKQTFPGPKKTTELKPKTPSLSQKMPSFDISKFKWKVDLIFDRQPQMLNFEGGQKWKKWWQVKPNFKRENVDQEFQPILQLDYFEVE